jgi:curved DNA-binding protein CbpA
VQNALLFNYLFSNTISTIIIVFTMTSSKTKKNNKNAEIAADQLLDSDTNLYELLEITETATADDIKRAYRRLALRYHPDKQSISANGEERAIATRQFQRVGLAYAILSDEKRRARYNRTGEVGETLGLEEGADWNEYFKELFNQVDDAALTKFAAEYRGDCLIYQT